MGLFDIFRRKKKPTRAARAFAAAQYNRLVNDWMASSASIDSEMRGALKTLRNRTRDLCRNNDYAKNALRAIENNVIGQGIRLQSQVMRARGRGAGGLDEKVNAQIEAEWSKWCKADSCHTGGTLNFADIERLLIANTAEAGDIFVRMVKKQFGRSKVPFALEIIEADQLDEDFSMVLNNGNTVRMGVEFDQWHRPAAYWFSGKHPGDYAFAGIADKGRTRVSADEVIHLFRATRPNQSRGFPWFASAIMRMHQLSGFEEAEVIKARAQASIMGFIKSPEGDAMVDGVQDKQRVSSFEPGTIETLLPGEEFEGFTPNSPGGQYEPFMRAMLRAFAAGIGVSYETLSRDYSQSNYSSSRQALIDDRDNWRVLQSWMIDNFHSRVFDAWLDMAWAGGAVQLTDYATNSDMYKAIRFVPRGWSWVDPLKEIKAYTEAVRSGFMTLSDVHATTGADFDEVMAQRKREIDLVEGMGLVFDTDSGKVAANGQLTATDPQLTDPAV